MCYYFSKTKSVCEAREGQAARADDRERCEPKLFGREEERRPESLPQAPEPDPKN